ncbi:MAG: hypothetical protein P8Q98_01705, partial [Candidatus Poseidoniaceae archaeon]|nr:hypothetical protein [Candidatus Poseidoniaceae archaeon]
MEPPHDPPSTLQDSVVGGNLHTGNVIHNHYHFTQEPSAQPQPQPQPQPIPQSNILQFCGWISVARTGSGNITV